jgi:23S rRNA (adenine2503-C2)-methyltransferase
MTDFGKDLRGRMAQWAQISRLETALRLESSVGDTVKYRFALNDGESVESVLMKYDDERSRPRRTLCISTQVGCAMGCRFCASTELGLTRNLEAWEIVDQVLAVQKELDLKSERVGNVVLMGIGEPLANYDNSLKALRIMSHGDGISIGWRHLSISTSGLVPGIKRLAGEHLELRLAVSLHSARDEVRERLMPINRKYPLAEVLGACKEYQKETGRRITFEYALIKDVNDSAEDARLVGRALSDIHALVNLIPLNEVPGLPFHRSSHERMDIFARELAPFGMKVTRRKEMGIDIDAACGQLRLRGRTEGGQLHPGGPAEVAF